MFKMKKFKVVVLYTIVYEVDVNADSKEEAENKVKDIDVNTNILDQTDNFDSLIVITFISLVCRKEIKIVCLIKYVCVHVNKIGRAHV